MLGLRRQLIRQALHKTVSRNFAIRKDSFASGDNAMYAEQMYDLWTKDPNSVHASWNIYFTNLSKGVEPSSAFVEPPFDGLPPLSQRYKPTEQTKTEKNQTQTTDSGKTSSSIQLPVGDLSWKIHRLIAAYRKRGHHAAHLDPLKIEENKLDVTDPFVRLEEAPEEYGFSKEELNTPVKMHLKDQLFAGKEAWTPVEIAQTLSEVYTRYIGFEYMHLENKEAIEWIKQKVENAPWTKTNKAERENLLNRILRSQALSDILEKKYGSSKRYGAEGCDSGISGMEHMADVAGELGVKMIIVGMPHRGRFNVMMGMFRKAPEVIFAAFNDLGVEKEAKATEYRYTSDVKYHMSASTTRTCANGAKVDMVVYM